MSEGRMSVEVWFSTVLWSISEEVHDPYTKNRIKAHVIQFADEFVGGDGVKGRAKVHTQDPQITAWFF